MKHTTRNLFLTLMLALALMVSACASPAPTEAPAPEPVATESPATEAPTEAPTEAAAPANPNIILATTTSTQDSGLLDMLVPLFEEQSGYIVQTIAVGSGEAMKMGEEGNADVLLVHAPHFGSGVHGSRARR
jgi:tungstate transport system substrate-binding protein